MYKFSIKFTTYSLLYTVFFFFHSEALFSTIDSANPNHLSQQISHQISNKDSASPNSSEKSNPQGNLSNDIKEVKSEEPSLQKKQAGKKTVCLNMIVKNESKVIKRCLTSVKPIIDYWVIVDTGSTDHTQEIIKEFLKDIPGQLHERPWKNFEHNRNEALAYAKGKADYVLLMDADDNLVYDSDFKMSDLTHDCYNSIINLSGLEYDRPLLINNALDWKWHGVLHEYLACTPPFSSKRILGLKKISNPDGVRSQDPQKYQKDALILEEALKEDPKNDRYVFYLAQSYRDAQDYDSALTNYKKRVQMGGWDQEVFWSKFQIARLQDFLQMPSEIVTKGYLDAYFYRPSRSEPLYYLTQYYRFKNDYDKAYSIASVGASIPPTKDILFVEKWIYDYGLLFEKSISAYWVDKFGECQELCDKLLKIKELPQNFRKAVQNNRRLADQEIIKYFQAVP